VADIDRHLAGFVAPGAEVKNLCTWPATPSQMLAEPRGGGLGHGRDVRCVVVEVDVVRAVHHQEIFRSGEEAVHLPADAASQATAPPPFPETP
jgi:hypothetical protein